MTEQRENNVAQEAGAPRRGIGRSLVDKLFAPWMEDAAAPAGWEQDAHRAYVEQQPLRARALLYVVAVIVVALVVWASIAEIDEVTRGQGKVIPSRQVQVIQSQDGGVVTEILVREGDTVEQGQLLVRLDQTRSQSSLRENRAEYQALAVKAGRLRAVADDTEFQPDPSLTAAVPRIVAQEQALYDSSRAELGLEKGMAGEQLSQRREELVEVTARERQAARSLQLTERELNLTRPMVASGAVSKVEILRLEREVNQLSGERKQAAAQINRIRSAIQEAESKVAEVELEFMNEVREQLADTITRMNALREAGLGLSDRVKQTEVRSPVNGTVKQLHYHTIGGVVLAGKEIIEVVPADDTLLLEVRIRPKDIAFLVPGQPALVKFTAYDFVVYGGLDGVVEHIGADTVMDEEGNPFYEILVRTHEAGIAEDKPIIPGMTVEADILTGKKTILSYLMKPVLRARQYAMTER
ncbi:secretion protein HylD [Halioglobus japonicus]|uniref:Membrane fusion protein (MFP) family protein n=1 Tax=Halioglobus japonicus TaxID=930805 RepID=A0AAP8MDY0_9GAMM|nr:HlyD family type I secretion periplasmic adaptor subunit [Halioglobus japonicus]AQA18033.1 secretion protein HylD [Halioglobus japonicus]PLW86023.1 HlyD family type I secretion periplasmic adaptor subunit [Halioglobus japonicus]GHD14891.1 HlyD family type I secretion periplasmic adaptor subunit [Halioglobus japonicus]